MGEVYLAVLEREGGFAKTVALKTILPTAEGQVTFAELFETEAATAAQLNHPNIVQVFDHGNIEGRSFLTMELVEGPDLGNLLSAAGEAGFPEEIASEICLQLCRGLEHAHSRKDASGQPMGIVHGDVSPSNVLLSGEGQVKLADFGLARVRSVVSEDGAVTGKYAYMSPEQAAGRPLTPMSDLFSLGIVACEMLLGKKLCPPGTSPGSMNPGALAEKLKELPERWAGALERSLQPKPADRFTGAMEMADALSAACSPCGPETLSGFVRRNAPESALRPVTGPEPTEVAQKPVSPTALGRGWKIALVVLFVLFWGAGFAWWIFHAPPKEKPAPPARTGPMAPRNLTARVITAVDTPEPPPAKALKTPADKPAQVRKTPPPPLLVLRAVPGMRVTVDHKQLEGQRAEIRKRKAHLIHLHPDEGKVPEVTLRLTPFDATPGGWRLSIRATPWMKIRLGKRPMGQTPKSNLPLPRGRTRLLLTRDEMEVSLEIVAPGAG
jgi:hypothetical protein